MVAYAIACGITTAPAARPGEHVGEDPRPSVAAQRRGEPGGARPRRGLRHAVSLGGVGSWPTNTVDQSSRTLTTV